MSRNNNITYKDIIKTDKRRVPGKNIPSFQCYFRRAQCARSSMGFHFWKCLCMKVEERRNIEIYPETQIGEGLYIGHPYCITINPEAVIGKNCNIHRGVLIGRENRGKRVGTPIIGDNVWIGINAAIVGNIKVGNDVLIAPNSYVNCDIPDHSIVFGNPCIVKHKDNATEGYINNAV